MKILPFSKVRSFVLALAILILTGGIGYRLGESRVQVSAPPVHQTVVNQAAPAGAPVDFSLFWDVWQKLFRSYIDKADLNSQKMVWGAISGMVNSLGDPYTLFLPPKENQDFKEDLSGSFEGIGAQLGMKDNHIIIIAPIKGAPAEKAGILAGDYILKVNNEETVGWTVPQAVNKIRGPHGTTVTLNILHEKASKPIDMTVTREAITIPSVEWWIKPPREITEISAVASASGLLTKTDKVAYIRLTRFGDHTNEDWEKAIVDVLAAQKKGGVKGVVFDLRNNPGGYLEGSVYIASEFIKSGVVVSQVNSDGTKQEYPVNRKGRLTDVPVVVLINKGSASAAEIAAGALRDYKRATLVGETSFGKGSVQTPEDLAGGAGLHITTGKWLLPKGDSINKKGVTPDVAVSMDEIDPTKDTQLAKAIELLLK